MADIKKILLVGLDKAGKTSILNILRKKYDKMDGIKPTAGIERTEFKILGIPILSWDLGGQEGFRERYLKDVKIFAETDTLVFVMDSLDTKRYELAVRYYSDILAMFKRLDLKPKVTLCIHKMDPNIRNSPNVVGIIDEIKSLFLSKSDGFEVKIYITSIYDLKTIVEAFSKTLQAHVTGLKQFKDILESILSQYNLDAVILLDDMLMILSESYRNMEIEEDCLNRVYNSVYYMSTTNPQMADDKAHFAQNFEFILNLRNKEKRFNFMEVKFEAWSLYLITMGDEKLNTYELIEKFNSLADHLKI